MRIGYLTYGLDRSPTGIGRYSLELLRSMVALPERPEIVVLATENDDPHSIRDLAEYHHLPGCRTLPALLVAGNVMLPHAMRRFRLDAIHDPNAIAPFLWPEKTRPRIVTIHDAIPYVYPDSHNRLDNWRFHWHLPVAVRRADIVVTSSEYSKNDLITHLGVDATRIRVVPGAVDQRFAPVEDEHVRREVLDRYGIRPPYLLYIGSLNGRKNIGRLIEAFWLTRTRHPSLTLVLGGKREWKTTEIDRTMQRLDLKDQVIFTGYVEDEDLPALYSSAEVFVFPSLYEGFGLPPLEAMACGAPVIVSNVSSLPEVVDKAAVLVDPIDVGAIADGIDRVLSDVQFRETLRTSGFDRAKHFTWQSAAIRMVEIYQQVLGSVPGRLAKEIPVGSREHSIGV